MSDREAVQTSGAPAALGPYSQGIVVRGSRLVFSAGQIGLDPATGQLVSGGIEAEAARVLDNLEAILKAAGSGLDRVVRTTLYLTDLRDFEIVNAEYARRVGSPFPARSTVGVASLPKGARIEIDMIAAAGPDREGA
ncbi:MAG: RidA family protein [Candidatus Eisenbacteria bacterium]|nr:RidA family protein [Candidatus Eisenbacteria bacterium]